MWKYNDCKRPVEVAALQKHHSEINKCVSGAAGCSLYRNHVRRRSRLKSVAPSFLRVSLSAVLKAASLSAVLKAASLSAVLKPTADAASAAAAEIEHSVSGSAQPN